MTIEVRTAGAADAAELTRLREEMFTALHGAPPEPGQWQEDATAFLHNHLPEKDSRLVAFVVDDPNQPGRLASCAIGFIDTRLAGPNNPVGDAGFVMSVSTDPAHRRRGYSRACMAALMDWFAARGMVQVNLIASPYGEPLYEELGFKRGSGTNMRLWFPKRAEDQAQDTAAAGQELAGAAANSQPSGWA
jgi:RimJ/RimL family protein N-acetyltransferase